jgi:hypothetical protein
MNAHRLGLYCAGLHFLAFVGMATYIARSVDPQAPMLWAIFAVLDFPVSLLYYLSRYVDLLRSSADNESWINQFLYMPHLIHGVVGTMWWYFLPRFLLPRRLGGVW